jgi:lantibiotic modifying enzyme
MEGGALGGAFWCHGAAGAGRFFAHAAQLGILPEAEQVAARAARAVAGGARWIGPTQCHGLAGNIEFLLDMAQATGDRSYRAEAQSLARLLEAFASDREGGLMWPSESPLVFTPDYMVGYAGVAACLLRLSAPERLAHQLSRAGFGRPKAAAYRNHDQ